MAALSATEPSTSSASARPGFLQWARNILFLGVPKSSPIWFRVAIILAMVVGAATVGASGAIHLHLWFAGYRHVPRIGPLFLAQSISAFVLAPTIVLSRRTFAVLAGAGFQAVSVVGLLLSATVGFLGIHDGLDVPWASTSIILELIGFVVLATCGCTLVARR